MASSALRTSIQLAAVARMTIRDARGIAEPGFTAACCGKGAERASAVGIAFAGTGGAAPLGAGTEGGPPAAPAAVLCALLAGGDETAGGFAAAALAAGFG